MNATPLIPMPNFYVPPLKFPRDYSWRKPDHKYMTVRFNSDKPTVNPQWDMIWVDWLTEKALTTAELRYYYDILDNNPKLGHLIDRVIFERAKFTGGGLVVGYDKRGKADEVPADLERHSWVMTAKSVKEIGVDKLYKLLHKADPSTA